MRAPLALAACLLAVFAAASFGQSAPPPCPPGTELATLDLRTSDNDSPQGTTVVATHSTELDAHLNYGNGAAISLNERLTLTPPPGLTVTPTPDQGDPSEAGVVFSAPASPGTLMFTATWTQYDNYTSQQDCTGSAQVPVAVGPDVANKVSHVFGALQHWAGRPGTPANVLSVGWSLETDVDRGDATPVTISVRAVSGSKPPSASIPALTSTWDPLTLLRIPTLTVHSKLVRIRSATLGLDRTATNKIDIINASIYVYPPHGVGTTRRAFTVDVTEGPVTLVHYQLVTKCTKRRHRALKCSPMPHGGT
jgi:hypothetical protein